MSRRAVIVGAGPAGLTAAYELLHRTDCVPAVFERDAQVGGLSKTVRHGPYRLDIGGHRFFSKSDRVMQWWLERLPLEAQGPGEAHLAYRGRTHTAALGAGPDPAAEDRVMLVRQRHSRIVYAGEFFDYPISLSPATLWKLGPRRALRIAASYAYRALVPLDPVENLEDFLINRFGGELYRTFFKAYTEKVWGVECRRISAAWGAQRIKDVSIGKALRDWLRRTRRGSGAIDQKDTSTSLIERFLYPKFGPGQLWEETARIVEEKGGTIELGARAVRVHHAAGRIAAIDVRDEATGAVRRIEGDLFFSTMPVSELVAALDPPAPGHVAEVARALEYRDFLTVGLRVRRLRVRGGRGPLGLPPDTWLYVQEPSVRLGRIQLYNNWSPYMTPPDGQVWLGLEYFCQQGDALWSLDDAATIALAAQELVQLGFLDAGDVEDGMVLRIEKAYPAYYGAYHRFGVVRSYLDAFGNLFLIGRNGMHKYNNQDHSMLAAMTAVDNIAAGSLRKDNLWAINTEEEYLEEAPAPGGEEDV